MNDGYFVFLFFFARFLLNHLLRSSQRKQNDDGTNEKEKETEKNEHSTLSYRWLIVGFIHIVCMLMFINVVVSILWLLKFRRNIYVMIEGISNMMSLLRYKWRLSLIYIPVILTFQETNPFKIRWQYINWLYADI